MCVCPLTLQRTHGSFLKSQSRFAWSASPQHLQMRLLSGTGLRQWLGACPTLLHLLQTFRSFSHEQTSSLCFPPHLPHGAPAGCCCFALVRFALTPSWFPDGMEAELEGDPLEFHFHQIEHHFLELLEVLASLHLLFFCCVMSLQGHARCFECFRRNRKSQLDGNNYSSRIRASLASIAMPGGLRI